MHFANNFPTLNIRLAKFPNISFNEKLLIFRVISDITIAIIGYRLTNNSGQFSIHFIKLSNKHWFEEFVFLVYLISRLRRCSGFDIILELKLFFRRMHFDVASHKAHTVLIQNHLHKYQSNVYRRNFLLLSLFCSVVQVLNLLCVISPHIACYKFSIKLAFMASSTGGFSWIFIHDKTHSIVCR